MSCTCPTCVLQEEMPLLVQCMDRLVWLCYYPKYSISVLQNELALQVLIVVQTLNINYVYCQALVNNTLFIHAKKQQYW